MSEIPGGLGTPHRLEDCAGPPACSGRFHPGSMATAARLGVYAANIGCLAVFLEALPLLIVAAATIVGLIVGAVWWLL